MNKYTIPNLKKACDVLKALSKETQGLSLPEISEQLDIPRTTALRILSTFCDEGMTKKVDTRYCLGDSLIRLGLCALAELDIRTICAPVLRDLADKTGETAHLAVLSGDKALILEVCDSPHPLRVASRPGALATLHCSATGKVMIAFSKNGALEAPLEKLELARQTSNTITDIAALHKEMSVIRARGYALDDEEYHTGVRCLAAPVWDAAHNVVAAIGITGTASRFTRDKVAQFSEFVIAAAEDVSRSLGSGSPEQRKIK